MSQGLKEKNKTHHVSSRIGFTARAYRPVSVALTDCPKVAPLSEFICLSILALTFSQLFPRAARFSRVDRRDDWRHYRGTDSPAAKTESSDTHTNARASVRVHTHTHTHTHRECIVDWRADAYTHAYERAHTQIQTYKLTQIQVHSQRGATILHSVIIILYKSWNIKWQLCWSLIVNCIRYLQIQPAIYSFYL